MTKSTTIRLVDGDLQEAMDKAAGEGRLTKTVDIFGEQFTISTDVNYYLVTKMLSGDASAINQVMDWLVAFRADQPGLSAAAKTKAEDEDNVQRRRLDDLLARQRGLSPEVLIGLLGRLMEVAGERPTKSSSVSSASRRTAGGSTRSVDDD